MNKQIYKYIYINQIIENTDELLSVFDGRNPSFYINFLNEIEKINNFLYRKKIKDLKIIDYIIGNTTFFLECNNG